MLRALVPVCLMPLGVAMASGSLPLQRQPMTELGQATQDNPVQAIEQAHALLAAAPDVERRFWILLGLARAQTLLERTADAAATLAQARELVAFWPQATAGHRLWLELVALESTWFGLPLAESRRLMDGLLRARRGVDDAALSCEVQELDMTVLGHAGSFDEAWLAAEQVERCAHELGVAGIQADALLAMGLIAARGGARSQTETDVHFQRALDALGSEPARLGRSVILWQRGNALGTVRKWKEAEPYFSASLALSREIADTVGIGVSSTSLADMQLHLGHPEKALPLLDEARRWLESPGRTAGHHMLELYRLRIGVLAQLGRPEVIAEIARARRWDEDSQRPASRAQLARAMARGFASQQRFADAYAETQRAEALEDEGRALAADVQLLRLQARYEAARRDAENAELRHRSEAARLELEAQAARQRALWAAVALLATLSAAALVFGAQAWQRRRALADLALRDELTGAPNRRAVMAYAQVQFEQAQRLRVPLTLAMIDLDHFKRVNDTHGHAAGNAVLRALAQAAQEVLRGQDRLGRWGGEEWLLVMPGTSVHEAPAVFERLRQRFAQMPAEGLPMPHGCSFSMGAAALDGATPTLQALAARCDAALYRAKQAGRDRICLAD